MGFATGVAVTRPLSDKERLIARRIMVLLENNWTPAQVAEALGITLEQLYWFISQF